MKTPEQGFKRGWGVRVSVEGRIAHEQTKRERGLASAVPWPAQATFGWLLQLLIPFRRENVKLEQIQRRAAGM